jgi:hypothetical protein
VRLIGWCAEEKALVLELCSTGSLDVALRSLTWYQRLRVATHVARALLFLHMRRPEVRGRLPRYTTPNERRTLNACIPLSCRRNTNTRHLVFEVDFTLHVGIMRSE